MGTLVLEKQRSERAIPVSEATEVDGGFRPGGYADVHPNRRGGIFSW